MTIDEIYSENISVFFYKTIKMRQNPTIFQSFIHHSDIHVHATRNRGNLVLPRCRKARTQKGFFIRGIKVWNSLSQDIKDSKTVRQFKNNVRKTFL